jgi:diguanylate cyclase (GGDEF)-like protein
MPKSTVEQTLHSGSLLPSVSIVEQTMRQAQRAVAVALVGAALWTAVLLVERLWSANELTVAAGRLAAAHEVAARLQVTEQLLLDAVELVSITSDPRWIDRYEGLAEQLGQIIEHASLMAPLPVAERHRSNTAASAADVTRMRASAADALKRGKRESARALLQGAHYRSTSRLLREANAELVSASLAAAEAQAARLERRSGLLSGGAMALAMLAAAVLWRRLSKSLDQTRGTLRDAKVHIQRMASSDLLTGLDNRTGLHDAMHARLECASLTGESLSVLMIDLDRFKPVNDRNGHMVGDMVLKEVARRLQLCLSPEDLRARYGSDEFVVITPERPGPHGALATAQRIVERLSEPMHFGDLMVSIGASVGMATYPHDARGADELLRKADSALYRAKQDGRGMVHRYNALRDELMAERHSLELQIRAGIAAGQFVPHYQPIVGLDRRNVASMELLCRWRHPERGLVAPDKFISVAESSGLIGPLTFALLRAACRDMLRFAPNWRLSVNVAPQQIEDPDLVPQLLSIIHEAGLPPGRFDIELTETALVNDTARARAVILELKRAGLTVTLDDFGTGYSSLSYLAEMTFDRIKIDRSFVRTLDKPESAKIVDAIIGLSRSLGVDTVAEGVETEAQAAKLRGMGCRNAQGYLFGRPMPARELDARAVITTNTISPLSYAAERGV